MHRAMFLLSVDRSADSCHTSNAKPGNAEILAPSRPVCHCLVSFGKNCLIKRSKDKRTREKGHTGTVLRQAGPGSEQRANLVMSYFEHQATAAIS